MIRVPVALFVLVASAAVVAAQSPSSVEAPVIQAQGEAVVLQPPDIAWVQIAVEARGVNPDDARQRAAVAMTSVLATLKQAVPAEAIKTSIVSVQPEMDYPSNPTHVKDYVARNRVDVRVDNLDKLPGVIDASVSSGATSVSSLRFDVKRRQDFEHDALTLAVKDATTRAEAIARGAGRVLGSIVRIDERRVSSQGVTFGFAGQGGGGGGRGGGVETPVAPGQIEIRAIVVLTVAIK